MLSLLLPSDERERDRERERQDGGRDGEAGQPSGQSGAVRRLDINTDSL